MKNEKKIGVLMGGLSAERDISLLSGNAILSALREKGYNACSIYVDRDVPQRIIEQGIDVAFIALHGRWGEDGTIQGMLEIMGIPYTGSPVLASALAMSKPMTKKVLNFHKLPTPEFQVLNKGDMTEGKLKKRIELKFSLVVKPVSEGSSVGVSIVENEEGLADAIEEAGKCTDQIMIEEFIHGSEITVGILNGCPLPVIEIVPKGGLYDYKSKYTKGMTDYILPARLTGEQLFKVQDIALKAYQAIGCHGVARVDMVLDLKGNPYILEINTIPGMTHTSLLPKAADYAGLSFNILVEEILKSAKLHL
ncbi:MAG: D-alanine--D-alanine ligase [Desulfobacterales bacterium]|nr:D-alanine--D-alanine ligase [Desulfobacterales bacterium]